MTTPAAAAQRQTTPLILPEPILLPAHRLTGTVLSTHGEANDDGSSTATATEEAHILCVESSSTNGEDEEPRYFWLHRKIRTTRHDGSVRVGFVLEKLQQQTNVFQVAQVDESERSSSGRSKRAVGDDALPQNQVQMVAIRLDKKTCVFQENDEPYLKTQLSALQWVAQHASQNDACEYVQGPSALLAGDEEHVYTITPYDYYHTGSSTLFEYCATQPAGVVPEETARGFFQQIVKVRAQLNLLLHLRSFWPSHRLNDACSSLLTQFFRYSSYACHHVHRGWKRFSMRRSVIGI